MKMSPEDVLEEFISNADVYALGQGDGKLIAEREDFDVQIFLSGEAVKAFGPGIYPVITVIASGEVLYDEPSIDEDEFLDNLTEVYDTYLTSKIIGKITEKADDEPAAEDPDDHTEEINLRERELDLAVEDFLFIVYGEDPTADRPDSEKLLEDLKDKMLVACAEIIEAHVYRPVILEDDKDPTKTMYVEYPYA